ncbi:B12-binding domain-containing protein [bacterium]
MKDTIQDQLFQLMLNSKKEAAIQLIEKYADQYDYEKAILELLEPALHRFGIIWGRQENVSLAQGYIAARIAEEVLNKVVQSRNSMVAEEKGPVVIGNVEDDYHALGRKMVCTFLRTYGWQVIDMGNDVLAEDFINKACEVGARVIGVSAMMYTTAVNIRKVRDAIDKRGLQGKIRLAVGGAVFTLRPELVQEVGGDGTAANALAAPELMQSLWEASEGH